jgi:predicted AAA+ superfamily ATPase
MDIPRIQQKKLKEKSLSGKVTVVYGPRRVGKTTLLKKFLEDEVNYLFVTGEDLFVQRELSSQSIQSLGQFLKGKTLLVVDEAQYIPSLGLNLKLIVDQIPGIRIVVTGSSTFDLVREVGAPLTGRQTTLKMYPIAQLELDSFQNRAETEALLEQRLIYGSYPEVITHPNAAREYLRELISAYLLKDILAFEGIRKAQKLVDLLVLIAFQIGKEVSHHELATHLGISKITVEKYLDLLEKTFVLVNIRGFSRNLRKEISKTSRYYFIDPGIRNALINNFNPLSRRDDVGALWEGYLVCERLKKQEYEGLYSNNYFWRTYDQKEVDWVEEREGKLFGYEFKWTDSVKAPKLWLETYPQATFETVNRSNYFSFIT